MYTHIVYSMSLSIQSLQMFKTAAIINVIIAKALEFVPLMADILSL